MTSFSVSGFGLASFWFLAACAVGFGMFLAKGADAASSYAAGYLLEMSLSVDNFCAFLLLFRVFNVDPHHQGRVLHWGIIGAGIFRAAFIGLGAAALTTFRPILLICAIFLFFSACKLLFTKEDDGAGEHNVSENRVVVFVRRFLPVADHYSGDSFFTVVDGRRMATPLLLVLVVVELTDMFAVDSIPAVFGVTQDPIVVWAASIMAILGLRALFGVVAESIGDTDALNKPVALILLFISGKICADFGGYQVSTKASLLVVCSLLGYGALATRGQIQRRRVGSVGVAKAV